MAGGITVQELFAKLGVQVDQASFARADSRLQGVANTAGAIAGKVKMLIGAVIGGTVVNAFLGMAKELYLLGDAAESTADKFGIGKQALQELQYAARYSDVELGTFDTSLRLLSRNVGEAQLGTKVAVDLFKQLGVSIRDTNQQARPIEDVFRDVVDVLSKVESPAQRTAYAMQIFGRSGADMGLMVMKGAKGVDALREAARRSGTVLSDEFIDKTQKYEDSMRRWEDTVLSVKIAIVDHIIPAITRFRDKMSDFVTKVRDGTFFGRNFKVALLGVGSGLAVFGAMLAWANASRLVPWIANLGKAGLAAVRFALTSAASATVAGIAFWPLVGVGLAVVASIAAIVAIIDDLYVMFTGGRSAIGRFTDAMFGIGATQEVVDSIKEGWKILGETFDSVSNFISGSVAGLGSAISSALDSTWEDLKTFGTAFAEIGGMIGGAIRDMMPDWLVAAWDSAVTKITGWVKTAGAAIGEAFKKIPGMETLMTAFSSENRAELSRRQTERAKARGVKGELYRGPSEGRADAEYSGYVRKYKKVEPKPVAAAEAPGIVQTIMRPLASIPTSTSIRNSSRSVNHTVNNTINVAAPANNQQALIANMRRMLDESNQKALGDVDDYAMQYSEVE